MSEKRCGTCDHWEFGQRSYCSWGFYPGAPAVSSAYRAGGECHAMAGSDGEDCPTWAERNQPSDDDLKDRVQKFQLMQLPGQAGMHMGTLYLVNDLWKEVQRLRAALESKGTSYEATDLD